MTRLINADALITAVLKNAIDYAVVFGDSEMHRLLVQVIAHQPTIDAVPVIRCKDCRFCGDEPSEGTHVYVCNRTLWSRCEGQRTAEGFCAWAEQKGEQ